MSAIVQPVLILLLAVLPFVMAPLGVSPYETPKVLIAEVSIELLVVAVLVSQSFRTIAKNLGAVPRVFWWIIALSAFDLLFLRTPFSLFGTPLRLQGIFLLWHLV